MPNLWMFLEVVWIWLLICLMNCICHDMAAWRFCCLPISVFFIYLYVLQASALAQAAGAYRCKHTTKWTQHQKEHMGNKCFWKKKQKIVRQWKTTDFVYDGNEPFMGDNFFFVRKTGYIRHAKYGFLILSRNRLLLKMLRDKEFHSVTAWGK